MTAKLDSITEANEWYHSVKLVDGFDYSELLLSATEKYREQVDIFHHINHKSMLVFSLSMGMAISASHMGNVLSFVLSVAAMVISAFPFLFMSKRESPMSIKDVFYVIENESDNFVGRLASSIHVATVGVKGRNDRRHAFVFYAAIALLSSLVLSFKV